MFVKKDVLLLAIKRIEFGLSNIRKLNKENRRGKLHSHVDEHSYHDNTDIFSGNDRTIRQLHQMKLSYFRNRRNTVILSISLRQITLVLAFCSTTVSSNISKRFSLIFVKSFFHLECIMEQGVLLFLTFFKQCSLVLKRMSTV